MDMHYNVEKDQNHIKIKNNNDDLVAFVDLINGGLYNTCNLME